MRAGVREGGGGCTPIFVYLKLWMRSFTLISNRSQTGLGYFCSSIEEGDGELEVSGGQDLGITFPSRSNSVITEWRNMTSTYWAKKKLLVIAWEGVNMAAENSKSERGRSRVRTCRNQALFTKTNQRSDSACK